MTLSTYLPQDRVRALARGEALPDRTTGSALFADISGFTPLTEALRDMLGARRGAEELTRHLDQIYTILIAEVERWSGSVIGFAGDAITCWFDDTLGPAAPRATACAFSLQQAMRAFASITLPDGASAALTLKVAVASGPARRLVVGDPAIHRVDMLAGATVARTSSGEHHAQSGEVLVDVATVDGLGATATVREWRTDESGERFAVLAPFTSEPVWLELPPIPRHIAADMLRVWVHHSVYAREESGQASFLTEFRPCTALFVRFTGIDYDAGAAQAQLDAFIRSAQTIVNGYEGTLLQITIGDKGSYAYFNFGALSAHEDDARRALKAAFDLAAAAGALRFLAPLQMGITQGPMRVGDYGGPTRRAYGALGDDVNLAARLMQTAAPGEILLSGHAQQATAHDFVFEPRPPLPMKGKAEPLPVFAATGARHERAIRLQEPRYDLPMVGRTNELRIINDALDLTVQGKSQIIAIVADAGMGKSRLVAEAIRMARRKGFAGYGGACQSDAVNTPYHAWKPIWSAFFDVDPSAPLRKQVRLLEGEIGELAPDRVQALPLLGILLNLDIPDNDFSKTLEPKYRQSTLRALLEDCLRATALAEPVLIVVEDLHWIDALSHDLLEELARALADSRVCFMLAYRPPQLSRLEAPRLEALPGFTRIELGELSASEAGQAIRAKLARLYPARIGAVPAALVDKLMARSQGNPFYLEELLNFLRDRGLDPRDPDDLIKIELPDSLYTLVLSRIDRLSEHERTTLRAASIVGRLFRVSWLTGYLPDLGGATRVQTDLDVLADMDITPLDSREPELAYLFKHIVTHEVTYGSLPFATRAQLHEQLAAYLEPQMGAAVTREASLLNTIAYHYGLSDNAAKKREYFHKAAQAALAVSAFTIAVEYLARLLELIPAADANRSAQALQLADVHFRLSDYPAARIAIQQAQAAAHTDTDRAAALALLGEMTSAMGDHAEAQTILAQAMPLARACGDQLTLCHALFALGDVNWRLGRLADARAVREESLALARSLGDPTLELFALNRLATVYSKFDMAEAERLCAEVHTRAVAAGNRYLAMFALNNLGVLAGERQDHAATREYTRQALTIAREIGAQQAIAVGLINLADADIKLNQFAAARAGLREGLGLALRLGALPWLVAAVTYFANLAHAEGHTTRALMLLGMARRHPAWSSEDQHELDATLAAWEIDATAMETEPGLAWDATIQELLKA